MSFFSKCWICGEPIQDRKHSVYCEKCDAKISPEDQKHLQGLRWTAIFLIPYIQVLLYYASKYRPLNQIKNSAGETEYDRFSRKENLIEGIGLFILIHFAMWILIGLCDLTLGYSWLGYIGYALMGLGGVYAIFISPYLHGDSWHGWGFSKPFEFRDLLQNSDKSEKERKRLIFTAIGLGIITALFIIPIWPYLLQRFGVRGRNPELYTTLTTTTQGNILAFGVGIVIFLALMTLIIRWDNLFTTLKALIPLALGFWTMMILIGVVYALVENDWSRFTDFRFVSDDSDAFLTHSFFYMLWGIVQQWLFLGYFNTRFRKGIAPEKKGPFSGKIWVALLTAIVFGSIHAPYWAIVCIGLLGGFFFGLFYQQDKRRNLFFMGLLHGISGTIMGQLTPIVLAAGPW